MKTADEIIKYGPKLKCPFCNSSDLDIASRVIYRKKNTATYHIYVYCNNCKASGPRHITHSKNKHLTADEHEDAKLNAIKLWNHCRL